MHRRCFPAFLIIALLFFPLTGCFSTGSEAGISSAGSSGGNPAAGGTETGNTSGGIALRVIGYQSSLMTAFDLPAIAVGDLKMTTAKVVLDQIRFRPMSVCQEGANDEGASDVRFDGPFLVDLLQSAPLNGLEDVTIPPGVYCRIEMILSQPAPVADPVNPMSGKSDLIDGTRADGVPFEMNSEVSQGFELVNETTGFHIDAATTPQVFFIAFDLDRWFQGVNLGDPSVDVSKDASGNPFIFINGTSNQSIQGAIEENIKFSSDLFRDSDGNDHLDPEEQSHPLAEGMPTP